MNKLEFACLLTRLQNALNVHIESDIVSMMYSEYIRTYFEKYTLFQLMSMLNVCNISTGIALNKQAIVNMINERKINIQCDLDRYSTPNKTTWGVYNMKYIDYLTSTYPVHISQNVICVTNSGSRTELMIGDIFRINKDKYSIASIPDDTHIILKHKNEETNMSISEFMEMLDTLDITIELNKLINKSWHIDAKFYNKISQ
jgi:hypothetical protein